MESYTNGLADAIRNPVSAGSLAIEQSTLSTGLRATRSPGPARRRRHVGVPAQRVRDVFGGEQALLPIRHRLAGAQAVEIDRDVNALPGERRSERVEFFAPVLARHAGPALARFRAQTLLPRPDFQPALALRGAVREHPMRPVELEIAA